jgi:hypothetical protein
MPSISLNAQLAVNEDSQLHQGVGINYVQALDHAPLLIGESQEIVLED